jgi:hypothetical protein
MDSRFNDIHKMQRKTGRKYLSDKMRRKTFGNVYVAKC